MFDGTKPVISICNILEHKIVACKTHVEEAFENIEPRLSVAVHFLIPDDVHLLRGL